MLKIPVFLPDDPDEMSKGLKSRPGDKTRGLGPRHGVRESTIEAYLVKRVKALGGEVRKVQFIGHRGAPDRVCFMPDCMRWVGGAAIWIELKAPGKKAEAHQLREHERMRNTGQRVEVVDSFARVDEVLS